MRSCMVGIVLVSIVVVVSLGCADEPLTPPPAECSPAPRGFSAYFEGPFGAEIGPALAENIEGTLRISFGSGFMLDIGGNLAEGIPMGEVVPEGEVYAEVTNAESLGGIGLRSNIDLVVWSLQEAGNPSGFLFALWQGDRAQSAIEAQGWSSRANPRSGEPVDSCGTQRYSISLEIASDDTSIALPPGCELNRDGVRFVNLNGWHYEEPLGPGSCLDMALESSIGWILNTRPE